MRRMVSAFSFLAGTALLAAAFLTPAGSSAPSERILRLNVNSTDITYLDPALNYDFYGWRLEALTCAMLLGYPDKAGRGKVVMYTSNDQQGRNTGQVVQANLKAIGLDVEVKPYTFAVLIDKTATRGEPFDLYWIGWIADYPDPYYFINLLLDGRTIVPKNNINTAYFNVPAYNRKMDAAQRLTGDARYRAYGSLDIDITRNQSPLVVLDAANTREFISDRIGCGTYSYAWSGLNLAMLCPKR